MTGLIMTLVSRMSRRVRSRGERRRPVDGRLPGPCRTGRRKRTTRFVPAGRFLAGMVAASFGAGCSDGGGPPEIAAVVEGVEISAAETEALIGAYLDRYQSDPQAESLPRDELAKQVLAYQIRLTLLEHLADRLGVPAEAPSSFTVAADLIKPEGYSLIGERKEDFARELRATRLHKAMAKALYPAVDVPEAALRAEYERRVPALERNWEATAQVARFNAEQPAGQVRHRVQNGEPFTDAASALGAEAVATVDVDPAATPLPLVTLDAIGQVDTGQVSGAIPAGDGWLAVLVERRRPTPKLTFEDLRAELTDLVAAQLRDDLFGQWFAQQFAKAKITVDDHYGQWNREYTTVW